AVGFGISLPGHVSILAASPTPPSSAPPSSRKSSTPPRAILLPPPLIVPLPPSPTACVRSSGPHTAASPAAPLPTRLRHEPERLAKAHRRNRPKTGRVAQRALQVRPRNRQA